MAERDKDAAPDTFSEWVQATWTRIQEDRRELCEVPGTVL
jgi:hypothetical protein